MKKLKYYLIFFLLLGAVLLANFCLDQEMNRKTSQQLASVIVEVKESYPQVDERALIENINEGWEDLDLSKYGIYELEDLPANESYSLIRIAIFLVAGFLFILLLQGIRKKEKRKRNQDIQEILDDFIKLQEGNYNYRLLNEDHEFSRLQNLLFKTSVTLREESENAKKDRLVFKNNLEDISHQIKTPLTSINLLLDNLEDGSLDPGIKKELRQDLRSQTEAITNLVLQLLKISQLESGVISFKKEEIRLDEIVAYAEKILKPQFQEKGMVLVKDFKDFTFMGDKNWEKEVFVNLMKNAIEHGQGDFIWLKTRMTHTYLEVHFVNRGPDMDLEVRDRVFDRFYRQKDTGNNFGIGLHLAKLIVEKDQGTIFVSSENGLTRFTVKYFRSQIF